MTGNTMVKQERRDHAKENGVGVTRANYNWINLCRGSERISWSPESCLWNQNVSGNLA